MQDRVALVTGASRGLGRAIALALAREGAHAAVNYVADAAGVNRQEAEAVVAEIHALGRRSVAVPADVAVEAEVTAMVGAVRQEFGRLDILVNNAGIARDVTLKKMSLADWNAVLAINLTGVFLVTREAVQLMREAGYGRVINIASVIGETGNIGQSNYAASKAGILGFTKSVAREVARRGITVNAIAPGFIQTPMTDAIPAELRQKIAEQIPGGRFGAPADVARVAVFLAAEAAAYITGQVFDVNGGLYM